MTTTCFSYRHSLLRWLLRSPLANPVEEITIPENRVLRFQNPMSFIGEDHDLRRHLLQLECREELHALTNGNPIIQLPMYDQGRCLEVAHIGARRQSRIHFRVLPRHAMELPDWKPELFRLTRHAPEIVHARMRNE